MIQDKLISLKKLGITGGTISSIKINTLTRKKFRSKRLREVRDIFLLSYYTGLSFADIMKIQYSNLILDNEGGIWIKIVKTIRGSYEVILLTQKAKVILDAYIPPFFPDNDSPFISSYSKRDITKCMKEIVELIVKEKNL